VWNSSERNKTERRTSHIRNQIWSTSVIITDIVQIYRTVYARKSSTKSCKSREIEKNKNDRNSKSIREASVFATYSRNHAKFRTAHVRVTISRTYCVDPTVTRCTHIILHRVRYVSLRRWKVYNALFMHTYYTGVVVL